MTILSEADELINADRHEDYGQYVDNAGRIAELWSTYKGIEITREDVTAMMILLKVARLAQTPTHRDSWLDIAGYVGCLGTLPEYTDQPLDYETQKPALETSKCLHTTMWTHPSGIGVCVDCEYRG